MAQAIEEQTGIESRCTVLGYLQRGGSPTAFDRVLSTRYGVAAAEACLRREYNVMVSLYHDQIVTVFIQRQHQTASGSCGQRNYPYRTPAGIVLWRLI